MKETRNFIHAIIFTTEEWESFGNDIPTDWCDADYADYVVHMLYDLNNETIVYYSDNTHEPINTQVDSYFEGIESCGFSVSVDEQICLVDTQEPYMCSFEDLKPIYSNGKYIYKEKANGLL